MKDRRNNRRERRNGGRREGDDKSRKIGQKRHNLKIYIGPPFKLILINKMLHSQSWIFYNTTIVFYSCWLVESCSWKSSLYQFMFYFSCPSFFFYISHLIISFTASGLSCWSQFALISLAPGSAQLQRLLLKKANLTHYTCLDMVMKLQQV